jgi:hypothetical protein
MIAPILLSLLVVGVTALETATFTNPDPISIPSSHPYPSTIDVDLDVKPISIKITFKQVLYTFLEDAKILLVNPSGAAVSLLNIPTSGVSAAATFSISGSGTAPIVSSVSDGGNYLPNDPIDYDLPSPGD